MQMPRFPVRPGLTQALRAALLTGVLVSASALAAFHGNEASRALWDQGIAAEAAGQTQLALEKYSAAAKEDPSASGPMSAMASLLLDLAEAGGPKAAGYRDYAEKLARRALEKTPQDPVAQEVLRKLADGAANPLHQDSPEAAKLIGEGEALYFAKKYDEALQQYERAAEVDPLASSAWVFAGDCFFSRGDYRQAEIRFRKATVVEPLNGQAWRFLADSLVKQNRSQEAVDALMMGIEAHPGQLPSWDWLEDTGRHHQIILKRLALKKKIAVSRDPVTGKVNADKQVMDSKDSLIWLVLSIGEGIDRDARQLGALTESPFQADLALWTQAMKLATEQEAKGQKLEDPGLRTMQMLAQKGQLEAGLLLLTYKESYRPDFEAWKKAHPDGVKQFIKDYGLRP
jgi:tetratricopeptide (TPR) repeat protein